MLSRRGTETSPVVGGLLADDQAEHGGLAGAVGPDQPDLLAGIELERGLDEQDLPAVLLADVVERDHGPGILAGLPGGRTLRARARWGSARHARPEHALRAVPRPRPRGPSVGVRRLVGPGFPARGVKRIPTRPKMGKKPWTGPDRG